MKKVVALFGLIAMLSACGGGSGENTAETTVQETESRVDELKGEVMQLHDKTMAQMGEMGRLGKQLKSSAEGVEDTAAYYNAYNDLTQAREDMMEWMHNFKNPDDMEASEDEKVKYLEEQREKMADISEYTDRSIEKANEVLGL